MALDEYERILVGVDLDASGAAVTGGSRRAALQAQWLAEHTGASLTFLHSTYTDLYVDGNRLRQGLPPDGSAALERLVEEYSASGAPARLVVTSERGWMEMIKRVLRGDEDLVVVARRNEHVPGPLGSFSRKLMRKCPAPVWIVKPDAPLVHSRVLAATDLTRVGDRAVALGAWVAQAYACELQVVHAWQLPLSIQMSADFTPADAWTAEVGAIESAAVKHIRACVARAGYEERTVLHVGRDAPANAIRQAVERSHSDLLVMGSISRGGIAGLLVGNTAERLLDKVDCALLVIKPADFVSPVRLD